MTPQVSVSNIERLKKTIQDDLEKINTGPNSDIESIVRFQGKSLLSYPESGSMYRALMAAGMQEKIKNATAKGHIFNIMHTPGSATFTLIETWINEKGNRQIVPLSFSITLPTPEQAEKIPEPLKQLREVSKGADQMLDKYQKYL
jgi:hypothetical protein